MSISPNVPSPQESYHYENGSSGTPRWITVLFAVLVAALVSMAYAGYSVQTRLEQELERPKTRTKSSPRNSNRPTRAWPDRRARWKSPRRKSA